MESSDRFVRSIRGLQSEVDRAFSELIHGPWKGPLNPQWSPAIDLTESGDSYHLAADLPGVEPGRVQLDIGEHRVTICGDRHIWMRTRSGRHLLIERSSGRFCRTIELPQAIDTGKVETRYENGIFEATLPKKRGSVAK